MSASVRRARDSAREAGGRGRAKFGKQSREVTVDVRQGPDFAEVGEQGVLVHSAEPEKQASIASMQSRAGAS